MPLPQRHRISGKPEELMELDPGLEVCDFLGVLLGHSFAQWPGLLQLKQLSLGFLGGVMGPVNGGKDGCGGDEGGGGVEGNRLAKSHSVIFSGEELTQ